MLPGPANTLPTLPADERQALELANAEEIDGTPGYSHKKRMDIESLVENPNSINEKEINEKSRLSKNENRNKLNDEPLNVGRSLRDRTKIRKPGRFMK